MSAENFRPGAPFPERVGRYELLLPIGSGGMASVYLARVRGVGGFEREVALKLLHAHLQEIPEFATELIDEAKIASGVRHPNVVQVVDVGDDPNGIYLVMEYIEGDTLSGLSRTATAEGDPLPFRIGVRILCDALAGLHAAHELRDAEGKLAALVHRDFSPQNILVGVDGAARLTDFGVARAIGRIGHTRTGVVKGKVGYMSPEQARGDVLDRRSDIWSAGVVAWELFAGRRLYPAGDDVATLLRIVTEPPLKLRAVRSDAPEALDDAISSALSVNREERCPTAEELRRRILEALKDSAGTADSAEVADYVSKLSQPKLAVRRERAEAVRRDRERSAADRLKAPGLDLRLTDLAHEPVTEAATVTAPLRSPKARRSGARIAAVIITAGILGVLGFVLLRAKSHPAGAAGGEASEALPATETAAANRTPAQAPLSSAPPTSSAQPSSPELRVVADAPIARLRIAGRTIALAPPERDVTVNLTAGERQSVDRLEATSADGRRVTLGLDPSSGSVKIAFPAADRDAPRPKAAMPHPPAESTPTGVRPRLAPSPYSSGK